MGDKTRGLHPLVKATVAAAAAIVLAEVAGRRLRQAEVIRGSRRAEERSAHCAGYRFVRLRDGRLMSYVERGDPAGVPIVYFHGPLGAGEEWPLPDADLGGIRLLVPERPGFGDSEPVDDRLRSDWVQEVEQWADKLGLTRFSIVAWSLGCSYALNCAAWLRDRVSGLDLVSSPAPVERQNWFAGYGKTILTGAALANLFPGMATLVARGLHASAQRAHTLVQELEVFLQPWAFELYEIRQPITLWAGGRDVLMRSELSEYLREGLRKAELHLLPEKSHSLIYPLQGKILRSALGKAAAPVPSTA